MLPPVTTPPASLNAGSPLFGWGKKKKDAAGKPTFYENKPNKLVMGGTERAVAGVARIGHVDVQIDAEDQQRLDRYFSSGDSLILTPNHSTALDALMVVLMGRKTGHRTARMGAKEIFEKPIPVPFTKMKVKNRAYGQFLQWNNTFSVDRNTDASQAMENAVKVLASGQSLTMFPQGHVTWKHHLAMPDEFKPGAATIGIDTVKRMDEEGQDRDVKLVPLTFVFDPKGEREEIEKAMDKSIKVLEKKTGDRLNIELPVKEGLEARLEFLFSRMVMERESRYLTIYPDMDLDRNSKDYYGRLHRLQEQVLETLETRNEAPGKGSFERRARKVKAAISAVEDHNKQTRQDKAAVQDILLGLSMYQPNYLNDDIGRQIEYMARLAHDIKGSFYSMRRIVTFLRKANVEVKIAVGDAISVRDALSANPVETQQQKKELALALTSGVQQQIQGHMDAATAAKQQLSPFILPQQ